MDKEQLQQIYLQEEYYWGKEPNKLAQSVLEYISKDQIQGKKAVDLGAGEGRDSAFFAKQGFDVVAMDFSPAGLAKAKRLAEEMGTAIRTMEGDLNNFVFAHPVDLVYSIGTMQYIHPSNRAQQFQHFKENTLSCGLNVLFAFTEHPDIEIAPDWGKNEYLYRRDELQSYYSDWETLFTEEFIFDCNSSGIPHRHASRILISKKSS
ncbi:methyltransferase domain-containing protein [Paenibacillus alkaliterrae]|uniref:class I SAM-dependent methyltransferase n=1 Tax=Paenibacillus alkaliterrae TaxID=320909 RepID=UPI001F352ED5|nr:class I SAM-dependent methyltransferase [Paenibacillus alkaliterrae]MCF2941463.1 methyltransferase domain-containing protein [Paenibacillus alkaliterrae]